MLSVVPAVSDLELSETEYVRSPRVFPVPPSRTAPPARCCSGAAVPAMGAQALHLKSWVCKCISVKGTADRPRGDK